MTTASNKSVLLNDTTEVVGYIVAKASEAIANADHPGHDLNTVLGRMTTDKVLGKVRAAYVNWANHGKDRPAGMSRIGVRLIEEYRRAYGI